MAKKEEPVSMVDTFAEFKELKPRAILRYGATAKSWRMVP